MCQQLLLDVCMCVCMCMCFLCVCVFVCWQIWLFREIDKVHIYFSQYISWHGANAQHLHCNIQHSVCMVCFLNLYTLYSRCVTVKFICSVSSDLLWGCRSCVFPMELTECMCIVGASFISTGTANAVHVLAVGSAFV